jgi:hypothetical protein
LALICWLGGMPADRNSHEQNKKHTKNYNKCGSSIEKK